jgi:hypothetical protein
MTSWYIGAHTVTGFEGFADNYPIKSNGPLNYLDIDGTQCTFKLREAIVGTTEHPIARQEFILTNLVFPHDTKAPILLEAAFTESDTVQLQLNALPDYEDRERRMRYTKEAQPSARLSIPALAEDLAADVCYALSIMHGQKIQWIAVHGYDVDGRIVWQRLQSKITKPYTALSLNYERTGREVVPFTAFADCFVQVRKYRQKYAWNSKIIDAWLDARIETDYLEARALKYLVIIETLRSIVLRNQPRHHLDEAKWQEYLTYALPHLHRHLTDELHVSKDTAGVLTNPDKWKDLNRRSFRSDMNATFKQLYVKEASTDVERFIASRNKIIHEGTFRCNVDPEAVAADPDTPQNPTAEYFFLASFVDRVVMQIFGLQAHLAPSTLSAVAV